MSGSRNNTMVDTTKHTPKPNRSPTSPGLLGSERYAFWNFLPTSSVVYNMLIVVAILLVLAIVYKHVAKPSWIPSYQQLSEKFRLYMARSMVGDFTRRIFNDWDIWTRSRRDTIVIPNRDEKSRRLSLDMSSSSSTSLSPSVLPTHNASPRSYKKTSNSRLTSHRRPSSRQKTQSQNTSTSSLSPVDDNPPYIEQSSIESSTLTEQDEAKTSVTIHVPDTLNSRIDPSSVKGEIDKIGNNQKLEDFIHENINSWTEPQQTPTVISNRHNKSRRLTADLTFLESTNNGSSKLQKKSSIKGHRKHNSRNKEQTVGLTTQGSDGEIDSIISDDHSDSLIQQSDITVPTIQKHAQVSTQEETLVKTGHKRRRRRTKGSKNNQQKAQQNQQTQNLDQRSLKQEQPVSSQRQDNSQQSPSKPRHHNSNEISKSRQSVEKLKADRNSHQHIESQSSLLDQTVYFLQANKRSQIYNSANLDSTAIPAKATLPESNRKAAVFPRTDNIHWKTTSSHASSSHNFNPNISNVPIPRFTTYADVIAPHKSAALPRSNTSGLSNGNNITTPVPAASLNNTTNHQWYSHLYSHFGSGLSIQLTPPASPQNVHRQLPSTNSNAPSSIYFKQSQDRNRNVIAPPPSLPASNNVSSFSSSPPSSLSMFTSSSFPSLSDSQNRSNVITYPANSSFRDLFGRKCPVQDQEKGELSDEADDSKNRNKIMETPELVNRRTQDGDALPVRKGKFGEGTKKENVSRLREQESQQQFSLFMYPPKS